MTTINYEQKYKEIIEKRKIAMKKYMTKLKSEDATEEQKKQYEKIKSGVNKAAKDYYYKNKDKVKEAAKIRYQQNKHKIAEQRKKRYQEKKIQEKEEEKQRKIEQQREDQAKSTEPIIIKLDKTNLEESIIKLEV